MDGRIVAGLAAAALIAALATGNTLLLRLAYVLVTVLIVAGLLTWTSVRGVAVSRRTRSLRGQVGGWLEEWLRVTNASWLPKLWLEIRDESDMPGHRAGRVVSTLMPGQGQSWFVRSRCRRRGVFQLGPMTIAGGDPLGLFRLERQLPEMLQFTVYPPTVPLAGLEMPAGYLPGGNVVRRRAEYATTNIRGVRTYQPGDAFNRIHWPTSARRGRLYTKEFELDPLADFWILVDLERDAHAGETASDTDDGTSLAWLDAKGPWIEPTTEEYAITIAASIGRHVLDSGKTVGLIAYGQRRIVLSPDRGERQLGKLLGALAVLRAVGHAALAEALSAENQEFTRHTTLVVVTPTTSQHWVAGLRELRHRGVASLVVLLEASTFGEAPSSAPLSTTLTSYNIPTRIVCCGDDIGAAIAGGRGLDSDRQAAFWRYHRAAR